MNENDQANEWRWSWHWRGYQLSLTHDKSYTHKANPNHLEHTNAAAKDGPAILPDLGLAVLLAENDEHEYEPIAVVTTPREAKERARKDLSSRMDDLENGGSPLCPERYVLWGREHGVGPYRRVLHLNPEQL